jgi:hypothetical protein
VISVEELRKLKIHSSQAGFGMVSEKPHKRWGCLGPRTICNSTPFCAHESDAAIQKASSLNSEKLSSPFDARRELHLTP